MMRTNPTTSLALGLAAGLAVLLAAPAVPTAHAQQPALPDTETVRVPDADATDVIDTEQAWRDVSDARDAAAGDRHHDAVGAYLDALANDARLVPLVAQELAYQKLWREDAEKSIFYFRRYLARHPGQENREVRKGLALALSWSGRQPEAVALYRELAAEDPSDGGARVGLARTLAWDNRLRESWQALRAVEQEFPAAEPAGREARDLALTVLDGYTAPLECRLAASWDSDDLDIVRLAATGSFTVAGNKIVQIMPARAWLRQPGQPDATALRLGAGLVTALAHNWSLHAYGWVDRFRSDGPPAGAVDEIDWDRPGGDFWVTWLPAPRVRLDAGAGSSPLETFRALRDRIGRRQANLSGEWRFARHWSAGLSGSLADYSDGNEHVKVSARATWKREGRWNLAAGPVVTWLDFQDPYPGGYWAPDRVRNGSVEITAATRWSRTTLSFNGSLGLEKETGADAITVGGASARLGRRVGPDWLAALEIGHSQSSFSSASGYKRTFASVTLRGFF